MAETLGGASRQSRDEVSFCSTVWNRTDASTLRWTQGRLPATPPSSQSAHVCVAEMYSATSPKSNQRKNPKCSQGSLRSDTSRTAANRVSDERTPRECVAACISTHPDRLQLQDNWIPVRLLAEERTKELLTRVATRGTRNWVEGVCGTDVVRQKHEPALRKKGLPVRKNLFLCRSAGI
jgi:hypothetical protein